MATIGKKFIEPDKWELAWFSRLSPGQKLLYCYLWERADHAGVIEIVYPVWSAHIGQDINEQTLKKLIEMVNQDHERIAVFGDKVFITGYIRLQQKPDPEEPLSGTHGFTKTIARLLKRHELYDDVKKRDPILFSAFEDKSIDSNASEPSTRLTQDYDKGLSRSRSKSPSRGRRESTSTDDHGKMESVPFVAESLLRQWSNRPDEPLFEEQVKLEDILKQRIEAGEELADLKVKTGAYLATRKNDGVELIQVLEEMQ
jgi:hypothetical protein